MTNSNIDNVVPANFLDLPPELKLKVLSNLSTKEVRAARSICKEIQDVIDEPGNRVLILDPIRSQEEARITSELKPIFDFPCKLNLRDFIFSYLIGRGVWEHPLQNSLLVNSAAAQWAKFKLTEQGAGNPHMSSAIAFVLGYIGILFLHAHNKTYYPELTATLSDDIDVDTIEEFFDHLDDLPFGMTLEELEELGLPLDREELGAAYLDIVEKRLYGSSTPIPRALSTGLAMPPHILTPLIARILGTDSVRELGDVFGYCLKTDWAMKRFSAALEGQVLTEWEKAAVLEDLYVF
ncbi:hypothetical protein CKM354_000086600 [Cercospora kikuchii]|uniref:F-box domain-containing protein n=1 Tax=Cercospora kikuchii TaxID=84275 RepID=A0A9P3CC97_9PEZI|nr:uncharacterized protein CKM354_000086600 [Cercospora kikuchii]GIZ37420.1 hypothetical protein CKM354_000086600 [Cercospora kikuchii]